MIPKLETAEQDILKGCHKQMDEDGVKICGDLIEWEGSCEVRLCPECQAKLTQLRANNKIFEEEIGRMKKSFDETDLELMFTDIKTNEGKKIPQSDSLMELFEVFWKHISKDLKTKLFPGEQI